mmetsp:Transcript_1448/g.3138  ORF Transcript_1448/g.3138 Transcript_1448/m.3138 type:complete len:105 (-) Transcript_1448:778-1092(-)
MCGERLRLLGRNCGSSVDELRHDTSDSLNTLGQGSHIQKKNFTGSVATLSGQNTTLNRGTISNGLIRVDSLRRLFTTKVFRNQGLDLGNTSGSTHKHNFVNLRF